LARVVSSAQYRYLDAHCSLRLWTPGGYRSIETLLPGDLVYSRDEWNPAAPVEAKVVEEVFRRFARVLDLRVASELIRTTGEHPFYAAGLGWTPASSLTTGMELLTSSGEWVRVDGVDDTGDWEVVYNLRVADHHTYFVGNEGWGWNAWAHNAYALSHAAEQKILYGAVKSGTPRTLIGGHSGQILIDTTGTFEVEIVNQNADGTTKVKFIKNLGGGLLSNVKTSTLAPTTWPDTKIIDVTKMVAEMSVTLTAADGRTLRRATVEGVRWEVIVDSSGTITSSYPTGGDWTAKL
jgi:hypothetical protein